MAENKGNPALARAFARAYTRKWSFLAVFVMAFFLTFLVLSYAGLTPESKTVAPLTTRTTQSAGSLDALPEEMPTRIEIPSIKLSTAIANPQTTDIEVLDAALLGGAVRHPSSAVLGAEGNTILFGHSSYLPVVHNQAYKAFNAIENLTTGDRIIVYGTDRAYVYAVDSVYTANATADAIPLTTTGHTLTLVTCDSFASKSDRFVVTATLVESYTIAS